MVVAFVLRTMDPAMVGNVVDPSIVGSETLMRSEASALPELSRSTRTKLGRIRWRAGRTR